MTETPAILVQNLGKKYRLFDSPVDRVREALHPLRRTYHREFWALKDVSFDIMKGQTVGILGRNGSGKSTLLQVIARVMPPTEGHVEVTGRVRALLELGAGFNPEFTGRENVVLNGVINGETEARMRERLPYIETFADIGEYFDHPTKTYSSGMFARLAFAAAVSGDPDILIIDEILAVGDARFRQKCYGRLQEFQREGKTILLVSHDHHEITKICDTACLLDRGRVISHGKPDMVADHYAEMIFAETAHMAVSSSSEAAPDAAASDLAGVGSDRNDALAEFLSDTPDMDVCAQRPAYNKSEFRAGGELAEVVDFYLDHEQAALDLPVPARTRIPVYAKISKKVPDVPVEFGFAVRSVEGLFLFGTNSHIRPDAFRRTELSGYVIFQSELRLDLFQGDYFLDFGVFQRVGDDSVQLNTRRRIVHLQVQATPWFDGVADLMVHDRKGD